MTMYLLYNCNNNKNILQEKNKVYSPLNVYMALAMLAETTDGESRQQILDLLHTDSIETLRNNASILWNANYCDEGTVNSLLASSVWLSDKLKYNENTLKTLAETYYTSSFSGSMGSPEYNKMLQDWLNEQTGGLLEEQARTLKWTLQQCLVWQLRFISAQNGSTNFPKVKPSRKSFTARREMKA